MKNQSESIEIKSASVSDRGLSEKRPLNEDSFLADTGRRIFAVADGVGGAQAGEVASQTAMEVLDEAFRHNADDADIEDLMEIAIQRANASINKMASEHPKLSMMATTIVALYLDGRTATLGHVGDSRIYRLMPDGTLNRETQDHSVVEEEVRAGRMTPAQAANHPSRNVISRALGAEESVEVDLKTIEIAPGTSFLLCSDGITRHVSDPEIRTLLASGESPENICAQLKKLCYERGAEDNLTAVIVRVEDVDDERTSPGVRVPEENGTRPLLPDTVPPRTYDKTEPLGMATGALNASAPETSSTYVAPPAVSAPPPVRKGGFLRKAAWTVFVLILLAGVGFGAFTAGRTFTQREMQSQIENIKAAAVPLPSPVDPATAFDKQRRDVDANPLQAVSEMSARSNGSPMNSNDPQFLLLYGRALLLSGKAVEASDALKKSVELLKDRPQRDPLKVDAKISYAAAALRTGNWQTAQTAAKPIDDEIDNGKPAQPGADSGAAP